MAAGQKASTKHGLHKTPEYKAWMSAKERCYNPKNIRFSHYGGRGIFVCAKWLHDFTAFFADMGPRPEKHSLDRIAPNGNYTPENCRWATAKQQRNNRRK